MEKVRAQEERDYMVWPYALIKALVEAGNVVDLDINKRIGNAMLLTGLYYYYWLFH